MLLTQEEIKTLTGYSLAKKQSEWLSENRIRHFVNRLNKVQITWESVNHPVKKIQEPDFSKVR
jgi:hypothetical protein